MLFINFKSYEQGTGSEALELISELERVSSETQIKIIPVVQAADIKESVLTSKLEIWAQHVDAVDFGAHTGSTIAEAVKEDGAYGTFLNHSEHKFKSFEELSKAHDHAKQVELKTLIFAGDIEELKHVVSLNPDFVSYEPPELVGSKDTSVSEAKPEIVEEAAKIARNAGIPLIVGAGIKSEEDVRVGLDLGAIGFAVASSIVKSDDPEASLKELIQGYTEI